MALASGLATGSGTTELDATLDVIFNNTTVAQFTRFTKTARWFEPRRRIKFKGKREVFSVYVAPMNNIRRSDFTTARAAAFPEGTTLSHERVSWAYTDMVLFQGSVKINELDADFEDGGDAAVYDLATKVFSETEAGYGQAMNLAIHQNTACQMGTVGTKYSNAGAGYSQAATCYISLANGTPSRFQKGMVVTINSENYTISGVVHGPHGPWRGGTRVEDIGPGLVLTAVTGNCDNVTATNAITLTGETTGDNFAGLPSWMSGTTNVYATEAGVAIDRDAVGNEWSIPFIETVAAAGSEVTLDIDAHLGIAADVIPGMIDFSRQQRREEGLTMPATRHVAIMSNTLVNESVRELFDTGRFTSGYMEKSEAEQKKLFGFVGFDGVVYRSPTLGSIAFQADPVAAPYTIDVIDPSSFFWLYGSKGNRGVEWLRDGGSRWNRVKDASNDNRPTFFLQAGCYSMMLLACDSPQSNFRLTGVKSSLSSL